MCLQGGNVGTYRMVEQETNPSKGAPRPMMTIVRSTDAIAVARAVIDKR